MGGIEEMPLLLEVSDVHRWWIVQCAGSFYEMRRQVSGGELVVRVRNEPPGRVTELISVPD